MVNKDVYKHVCETFRCNFLTKRPPSFKLSIAHGNTEFKSGTLLVACLDNCTSAIARRH